MKILTCGKGGCGKTTIVALLAKEIAVRKSKVLVIDSDESNIGLHSRLGMQKPEDFMNYFGGKKLLFEKTKELRGNALSSKFLEILDLGDEEFLIADTDAGIEHFGRGVEKGVDILLVIIDPSQESILLAKKISELGKQADKPVYYILNRIADQETEKLLLNSIDREKLIAIIPENKEIFISGLAGNEFNMDVKGISEIADMLKSKKKDRVKATKRNEIEGYV